jgi:methanogenic corrinoid protein MtbC1
MNGGNNCPPSTKTGGQRMEELKQLVIDGKADKAAALVSRLLDEGRPADALMEQALIPAMDVVGKLFPGR